MAQPADACPLKSAIALGWRDCIHNAPVQGSCGYEIRSALGDGLTVGFDGKGIGHTGTVSLAMPANAPILIVEDNADTREILQRVLAIRGYDVATAADGQEALAYLEDNCLPAAIILDIAMPNMDGIMFSATLQATEQWARIPIIVYTAMPTKRIPSAAGVFRKGTDDPELLFTLLANVMREH